MPELGEIAQQVLDGGDDLAEAGGGVGPELPVNHLGNASHLAMVCVHDVVLQ